MTRLTLVVVVFLTLCLGIVLADRYWQPQPATADEIGESVVARMQPGLSVADLDNTLTRHNAPIATSVADLGNRVGKIELALEATPVATSPTTVTTLVTNSASLTATSSITVTPDVTATADAVDLAMRAANIATAEAIILANQTPTPTPTLTPTPTPTLTPTNTPIHVVIDNLPGAVEVDPNSVATLVAGSVAATVAALPTQSVVTVTQIVTATPGPVVPPTAMPTPTSGEIVPEGAGPGE